MAEKVKVKLRIAKIEMADPITSEEGIELATWRQLPLTLRDDEVLLDEEDPEEVEVFSHENDAPEDVSITGKATNITGSFIDVDKETLVELLGGELKSNKFYRSAKKLTLNKALRLTLANGESFLVPNAKGYVKTNIGLGYSGIAKFPFKFKALVASRDWDVDIIF